VALSAFFGIGGASLNPRTERFLRDARFPYSCGFGLTETSSLIFGTKPGKTKFQSVGKPLDTLIYRIIRPEANTRVGEVIVKWGGNMKGYYKEPDMTASVLTDGKWFHTGDLAEMINGNLYLKGRSKTMILGPSGENIYPEEIESVLNRMEGVIESLVVEVKGKIVAKVYLNTEELSRKYTFFKDAASYHSAEVHHKISHYLSELQSKLNENLNKFSQVSKVELVTRPFEKTATHKIKRIQNSK
jgi:Long-chain acyl-CoA synthetases (AMP-forming)